QVLQARRRRDGRISALRPDQRMGHGRGASGARSRWRLCPGFEGSPDALQPARHAAQRRFHGAGRSRVAVARLDGCMTAAAPDIHDLLAIMARLRDRDGGCPWDIEQTFATIAPYTIEEAYEVADAIDRHDLPGLRDELGDLLLQVVFHARMAEEQGAFDFAGVVAAICDKMVRRHPHVFADAQVGDATAQTVAWEEHKRDRKS